MSALKVGDRVRITTNEWGAPVGTVVTVTSVLSEGAVVYLWEDDGLIEPDGWWASPDCFEVAA